MRELLSQKNLYNVRSKNIFSSKICHWRMSSPQPAMATSDYQINTRGKAVKYNLLCNSGELLVNPCKTFGSLDGFDKFVSKLLIWLVRWQIKSEIFENKSQMKFVTHFLPVETCMSSGIVTGISPFLYCVQLRSIRSIEFLVK